MTETQRFICYCENGHIEKAKLLWDSMHHEINIHNNNEYAFRRLGAPAPDR